MTAEPAAFDASPDRQAAPVLEHETPPPSTVRAHHPRSALAAHQTAAPLRIGLLNNMPDAALLQTERQFRRLVGTNAELKLYAFRDTPRGAVAAAHIAAHYAWHEELAMTGLDALIISGSEPRRAQLEDEPYYATLGAVVDWAAANTLSTLFSCLAAHAAVLHLDGIRRRRLPDKHVGIFPYMAAGAHRLLDGMPGTVETPHSRWHDLSETELIGQGYDVLRRSDAIGVDVFVRDRGSLFVFLQGHPEYDLNSLAREHRRDLKRFMDGSSAACPAVPANTFSDEAAAALADAAALAHASRGRGSGGTIPSLDGLPLRPSTWPAASAQLFTNWLACVAMRRSSGIEHRILPR